MVIRHDEYQERLRSTQGRVAEAALDALLLHQPESIYWLTGFYTTGYFSYHALLVPRSGSPILVIRDMEVPAAEEMGGTYAMVVYSDREEYSGPLGKLAAALRAVEGAGLERARIGIEPFSPYLTLDRYDKLKQALPNVEFVYEPRIVDRLRAIHSVADLESTRAAARVVERAMRDALAAVQEGVTERELADTVSSSMILSGGEATNQHVITSGARTNQLHGEFTDRVLQRGDLVYFELSGIVNHHTARLMRSTVLGEPTAEQLELADILARSQDEAIQLMKPGVDAATIDQACRRPLTDAAVRRELTNGEYTNRIGYALGPRFAGAREHLYEFVPGAEFTLESGMLFHMLVFAQGIGLSETVLVTDKGPEIITRFDRRLFHVDPIAPPASRENA